MEKPSVNLGNNKWATKSGGILGYEDGINKNVSPVEFDFSRASSGTTVNRQGLIELVDEGAELVVDGDFPTGTTAWTEVGNATINNESAKLTFDGTTGNQIRQSTITAGKTYRLEYKVVSNSGTDGNLFMNAFSNGSAIAINLGVNVVVQTAINTTLLNFRTLNGSGGTIELSNISVKEVLEEYPRIDFSDDVNGALLLEPTSTNLIKYSEDFSNSYWSTIDTAASLHSGTSPNGSVLSFKTVGTNGGTNGRIYKSLTVLSGTQYTWSCFVKKAELDWVYLMMTNTTGTTKAWFNISTGIKGGSESSPDDYTITSVGTDGWYRITMTATASSTAITTYVILSEADLSTSYVGDGTSGTYMYGAQLEQLPYATSYIPNYGNASGVTRVADVCNNGGSVGNFNSAEGVLYAEVATLTDDVDTSIKLGISNGSSSDRVQLWFYTGTNTVRVVVTSSTGISFLQFATLTNISDYNKFCIVWSNGRQELWVNGSMLAYDNDATTFPENTLSEFSFTGSDGSSDSFHGKVKDLRVYRTALTDDDLVLLTRPSYDSYESMSSTLEYTIR